jgi:hypothetical protein
MLKSRKTRFLAIVLATLLLLGTTSVSTFAADTPSSWASDYITQAKTIGLSTPELDGTYQSATTRLEFCRAAINFLRVYGYDIDSVTPELFSDTSDRDIGLAAALGITNGTDSENNLFSPDAPLTREQAATMLCNVMNVAGKDTKSPTAIEWTDDSDISSWAQTSADIMYAENVMSGTSSNALVFSPKTPYTHEQSLTTLVRLWSYLDGSAARVTYSKEVEGLDSTHSMRVSNWARISSVQQFAYKDEGLAFAYVSGTVLLIKAPSFELSLTLQYPKLGDVIADGDGNIYVIWGKDNEADSPVETIFSSKYTSSGQHIKTTGFVGKSSPWGDNDSAKTKSPFDAGNCQSVVADGKLVCYYAKHRYDGHQSDNVIAVNIADMSPYQLPNDTYSGHSFNQSVIWSSKISDFLFASQGDAYARGFRVNDSSGKYGNEDENIFHFWIIENAGYNMSIVNKTFAQMGGLAEIGENVAFVGASAKSLSASAETEKQNLFVQIFDPQNRKFIGGETRTGMTADRLYGDHERFTDQGVRWITNYTDKNVVAPQVVVADNKIVVLWSTEEDSFYTVLDSGGNTILPETSLGSVPLNSFEPPIYHNGKIIYAASKNGQLMVINIKID